MNKKSIKNGFKWSAVERISTQLIQLIVMMVLGRMLGPEAFGLIGMITVFIVISQALIDSGISQALIRKVERDEIDFSTSFYFNIVISIICYAGLYFSAPVISKFYNEPFLLDIIPILGLVVIINSFGLIQRSKLTILIDFKSQAKSSFVSVISSSVAGILFAINGFGVWSLVYQTLIFSAVNILMMYYFVPWFPKEGFCLIRFKSLFGFGSKLMAAGLIDSIFNNLYLIVIGKYYSSSFLGYFSQANIISSTPALTLTTVIQRVTYPIFCQLQNDKIKQNATYLSSIEYSGLVVFPLIVGLAICSEPFILLTLGSDWISSIKLIQILCMGFILYPIHSLNLNILKANGYSDVYLKLEIIKKILVTVGLFISVPLGLEAICLAVVINSYLSLLLNMYFTNKYCQVSVGSQMYRVLPALITCISIGVFTFYLCNFLDGLVLKLGLSILIYSLVYYFSVRFLFFDAYKWFLKSVFNHE